MQESQNDTGKNQKYPQDMPKTINMRPKSAPTTTLQAAIPSKRGQTVPQSRPHEDDDQ